MAIRTFRAEGESLLLHLLTLYDLVARNGVDVHAETFRSLDRWSALGHSVPDNLLPVHKTMRWLAGHSSFTPRTSLDDHLLTLAKQVRDEYSVEANELMSEADLLQIIVRLLKMKDGQYVLSGGNLRLLRNAILFPNERAKFEEAADQVEHHCVGCGHRFTNGEVTTYRSDHRGYLCTACTTPTSMCCVRRDKTDQPCDHSAPLPDKLARQLRKDGDCGRHRPLEAGETPKPAKKKGTIPSSWGSGWTEPISVPVPTAAPNAYIVINDNEEIREEERSNSPGARFRGRRLPTFNDLYNTLHNPPGVPEPPRETQAPAQAEAPMAPPPILLPPDAVRADRHRPTPEWREELDDPR